MSQHDLVLDNDTGANFRADANAALQALGSSSAGSSAPSTTYANQLWFDTANNLLKIRDEANANWVTLGELDGTTWTPYAAGSPVASGAVARSHLAGLGLSNAADADHDVTVAAGAARDDGENVTLELASAITKQIDAAWAVGDAAGGLDTGTVAADTGYHVWLIRRSDTGVVDALFSTSATSPTMPTNYDQKRRIGWVLTNGSANIIGFVQRGDAFHWKDPPLDVDVSDLDTTAVLYALSVPAGVAITAVLHPLIVSASNRTVYVSSPLANDEAPSASAAPLHHLRTTSGAEDRTGYFHVACDSSGRIRARASGATGFKVATAGWIDRRGKDD